MNRINFSKWEGTGNDFILIDDRPATFPMQDIVLIRRLCDRHLGIGSDGLILVQSPRTVDTAYHMEFFNPDGSQSFCGNGSRCAFAFSEAVSPARFTAIDGEHKAAWGHGSVLISMQDVASMEHVDEHTDLIHTGSPHLVCWVSDPRALDIVAEAHKLRYADRFRREGINVNFARWDKNRVDMRTYERGVEGETLSCGTGVTAAALSAISRGYATDACDVHTRGGDLRVLASMQGKGFKAVTLIGPVREIYTGTIEV